MPYKEGSWGERAKIRSKKRTSYFREYRREHPSKSAYKRKTKDDINPTFGRMGELEALKILRGALDKNKEGIGKYDIEWNGFKIDVKTSNIMCTKDGTVRWKFMLKQIDIVDYFLILCFNNGLLEYTLLIPSGDIKHLKHLSISKKNLPSKYGKYLVK